MADEGGLPVVLYNVPGRTGCDMSPEVVAQLRGHANIVGLKEARGDEARWDALYPLAVAGVFPAQWRRPDVSCGRCAAAPSA